MGNTSSLELLSNTTHLFLYSCVPCFYLLETNILTCSYDYFYIHHLIIVCISFENGDDEDTKNVHLKVVD